MRAELDTVRALAALSAVLVRSLSTDGLCFSLRDARKNVQNEPVRAGNVHSDEVNTASHDTVHAEGYAARQSVEAWQR